MDSQGRQPIYDRKKVIKLCFNTLYIKTEWGESTGDMTGHQTAGFACTAAKLALYPIPRYIESCHMKSTLYYDARCTNIIWPCTLLLSSGGIKMKSYVAINRVWLANLHGITWWYNSILRWRHNERDGVSNHQPHDCLLKCLFRRRSKKTTKLRVTGLCAGNSTVIAEFPAQRATNAENVSIDDVIMIRQ